uniref:Uncharacterized protein n=1 Tax=Sphaerodactylus townsendi TaxID=933632 RepID=A0ACB8E6U8_9SAUR
MRLSCVIAGMPLWKLSLISYDAGIAKFTAFGGRQAFSQGCQHYGSHQEHQAGSRRFNEQYAKKIDEENEANLLAVLTETLDNIPVDEDGLPSFDALTDGDVTHENDASSSPMPHNTPPLQDAEEPSLVRTCLPTVS